MSFFKKEIYVPVVEEKSFSAGKIILKTALITTAVLAAIPTVFKKTENGFEGYGILSTLKYEKKPKEDGGYDMNFTYDVLDLERLGVDKSLVSEKIQKIVKKIKPAEVVEPEVIEAEVIEAEVVEAEIVEAEVVEAEIVEA